MVCEDAPCCGCCGLIPWAAEDAYEPDPDDFYSGFEDEFEPDDEPDLDFQFEHDSQMDSIGWGDDDGI